jgi:O-antigen ligase
MAGVATFLTCLVIGALLFVSRDPNLRTSPALWLPVIWVAIATSRPVSAWLQMAPVRSAEQYLEGSPLDRNVFAALLVLGVFVLLSRARKVALLRGNLLLVLFFAYCAMSILWSDYPGVAFKRWVKGLGDVVMILVVLTEHDPPAAIKQLFVRVAFVFAPLSLLFIRYYGDLGRYYDRWEGTVMYSGVAVDKNMLGMACLVFGIALSWQLLQELSAPRGHKRRGIVFAHCTVLAMLVWLLVVSSSMTALGCFVLASGLMFATNLPGIARRPVIIHLMVAGVLCAVFLTLFADIGGLLLTQMGRDPTLTGRTDLWSAVLTYTTNPMFGTGFESFWLGPRLEELWGRFGWQPNQAHNGYLETYLNLGWVGVCLLAFIVIFGYRRILDLLRYDPAGGQLRLAFFVVVIAYNFTEAAFKSLHPVWLAFLLSVIAVPKPRPEHGRARSARAQSAYRPARETRGGLVKTASKT